MSNTILTSQEAFLAQFEPSIRPHLIEFGKRLSQTKTDIFITMARKATCLVNGLDALGLTALNATVTSDRVKDMDLSWVKGKRVTLIDDVVVFGSTLAIARDELLKAGAADVQASVLCVSQERWDRAKIEPSPPFLVLPHAQVVSVCATIVDAISVLPMPYAVDYPVFSRLRVPERSMQALFGLPVWSARDVSSPWQREHGVFSITCSPPPEVLAEFENRLGWSCAPLSLAKIRLYIRQHPEMNSFWQCSALPIVILQAMSGGELDALWARLKINSGYPEDPAWAFFTSPTSRLRLLHYLAASCLACVWLEGVARHVLKRPVLGHSRRMLESLFSPPSLGLVQRLVESRERLFKGAPPAIFASDPPDLELRPDARSMTRDIPSIRARLSEPFVELERTTEREAQSGGRMLSPDKWEEVRALSPFNRLERGYSHTQLQKHMAHLGSDATEAVSLFLDQAIDRGVVVPITTDRNGKVFRAYRHGEDVLFSRAEIRLFGLALQACSNSSKRSVLPHLLVEKLLVLLIRIGVQQRFLHPFLGVSGSPGTVGIRFSLHGAVAQSEVADLYGHDEERWLSHLLEEHGVIHETPMPDGPGSGYRVDTIIDASVYANAENQAKQVGNLIGYLHRPNTGAPNASLVSLEEWTLVATCANDTDVAAALAAEIDIFCRGWLRIGNRLKSHSDPIPDAESQHTSVLTWLRHQRVYIAMNSAKWKLEKHIAGIPHQLVYQEIPKRLTDALYQSVWTSFWPAQSEATSDGRDPQVTELLQAQAMWVYECNIYTRLLMLALSYEASPSHQSTPGAIDKARTDILADLEKIASDFSVNCTAAMDSTLRRDIDLARTRVAANNLEAAKLREYAANRLDGLVPKGRTLLAEAAIKVGNFGRVLSVTRFPHVLHIDIGAPAATHRSLFDRGSKVIRSVLASSRKEESCIIQQIPSEEASVLRGFWVCGYGPSARKWLLQMAAEVIASTGQHVPVRAVLFAELPRGVQLMCPKTENRFLNPIFWERASAVIDQKLGLPKKNELHVVTQQEFLESIRAEVGAIPIPNPSRSTSGTRAHFQLTRATQATRVVLDKTTGESAQDLTFPMTLPPIPKTQGSGIGQELPSRTSKWHYDVGILAIIPTEIRAILDYLSPGNPIAPQRVASSGRIYYTSTKAVGSGKPLRVAVTQALTQGNRSIVSAFNDMVTDYNPQWIVLLGIAGSIHKDAKLTDVVVAEQSIYYDKRAETESGTKHRGESYNIDPTLLSVVNTILVDRIEHDAAVGSFASQFTLHLGPIGTGEAVVKFRDAEVRKWLSAYNEKTLALETEAGGFGQALYELKLNPLRGPRGTLIVRGISDHADHAKDDKWQYPAAQNCCRALDRVLSVLVQLNLMGPELHE